MKLGKWKNITIVILLLSSYISFAQTNIDSLKILLQKSTDVDRVNILNELAESHKRIQPQKTVEYGKEALSLSTSLNNESLIAFSLSNIGDGEMILGNIDTAELYYNKAFNIYDKQQDFLGLSDIYLDLGNIFFFRAYYDSATEYYNKSIGFKIDLNESKGLLSLYNNLGAVYKKTGKYDLAIEAFENAIELSNKFNEPKGKGSVLINLADIYFLKGELSKAMKANYDALKNGKSINDNYTISNAYTNLSEIYSFLEDYQSALEYQKKSLIIDHKLEDWEGIITAYKQFR